MGLGDVTAKVVPEDEPVAPPRPAATSAPGPSFPHRCHAAIGVLGAVSVATACALPGSVATDIARPPTGSPLVMSVEHPSGEFR